MTPPTPPTTPPSPAEAKDAIRKAAEEIAATIRGGATSADQIERIIRAAVPPSQPSSPVNDTKEREARLNRIVATARAFAAKINCLTNGFGTEPRLTFKPGARVAFDEMGQALDDLEYHDLPTLSDGSKCSDSLIAAVPQPSLPPSGLHQKIMDLPCGTYISASEHPAESAAYKMGFHDARHAAAELALASPGSSFLPVDVVQKLEEIERLAALGPKTLGAGLRHDALLLAAARNFPWSQLRAALASPLAPVDVGKVREALAFYADEKNWKERMGGKVPPVAHFDEGNRARAALDSLDGAGGEGWVSVKDRLPESPESNDYMLVMDDYTQQGGGHRFALARWTNHDYDEPPSWWQHNGDEVPQVTHWRPLPAPPVAAATEKKP